MKHNPQFKEIEKKVYSKLSTQEKQRVNFDEYREVVKLIEERSGLSITEFYRWLSFWWLDKKGILHLGISPRDPELLTSADLRMTDEECNIQMRRYAHRRNCVNELPA